VPGLIGSLMRFPYTFAVTTFGGHWTILQRRGPILFRHRACIPLRPAGDAVLADAVLRHGWSWRRNFRLEHGEHLVFYPDRMKGWALGRMRRAETLA